jgi:hypothetical protein
MKVRELKNDDLKSMVFMGEVVDIEDPIKQGRARVRVFGKFDDLADDEIPWANQQMGITFGTAGGSGAISIPRKGAVVNVMFDNGNLYSPYFYNIQEASPDLLEEIKNSYEGAHALIYDKDEKGLKVFYTREKGLNFILDESRVTIESDNAIVIEHKGTSAIIELRGNNITITADSEINATAGSRVKVTAPEVWIDGKETKTGHVASYSQVLGEPLFAFLKTLSAAVDAKLYPTPSAMASACALAEQLTLSQTCKISK